MPSPRGPQIITALSFSANPPTAYVREMDANALAEALNNWIRWRSVHGRGRHEGAVGFRREANLQLGRIRRELARRKQADRKRTAAYYNGFEDAQTGAGPDYGQYSADAFKDYQDGYRAGRAEAGR